jgi:hypothetical protein
MLQLREKRLKITLWTTEEFLSYCFFTHRLNQVLLKKSQMMATKNLIINCSPNCLWTKYTSELFWLVFLPVWRVARSIRWLSLEKDSGHWPQQYGFSPLWISKCWCNKSFCKNTFKRRQRLHSFTLMRSFTWFCRNSGELNVKTLCAYFM